MDINTRVSPRNNELVLCENDLSDSIGIFLKASTTPSIPNTRNIRIM